MLFIDLTGKTTDDQNLVLFTFKIMQNYNLRKKKTEFSKVKNIKIFQPSLEYYEWLI